MLFYTGLQLLLACMKFNTSRYLVLGTLLCILSVVLCVTILEHLYKMIKTYVINTHLVGEKAACRDMLNHYVPVRSYGLWYYILRIALVIFFASGIAWLLWEADPTLHSRFVAVQPTQAQAYLADSLGFMIPASFKEAVANQVVASDVYSISFLVELLYVVCFIFVYPYKIMIGLVWYLKWKRL